MNVHCLWYFIILTLAMSASPKSSQTAETAPLTVETLRLRNQVRPLTHPEEGTAIGALSAGVYGYTCAPGFDEVPVFSKRTYHSFEVHKASDGAEYLMGFVTTPEAKDLELRKQGVAIRLFPEPWENSQSLVSVPALQILAPKRLPPREDGNPFLFTIA
jgi:hypothetical protein